MYILQKQYVTHETQAGYAPTLPFHTLLYALHSGRP